MGRLSIDKRKDILRLIKEGKSQRRVAKLLHVSRCAVQALLRKFRSTGCVEDRSKSGRPCKTTIRERRHLILLSKNMPFHTARELQQTWDTVNSVCTRTVRNILCKYGLRGRISAKKPLLTKRHLHLRRKWCNSYKKWTYNNWKDVIFSDESKIDLRPKKRQYVRRGVGSRHKTRYTTKTVKFGGKSLMVWGFIKSNGERCLIRCNGNVDSSEYQRVLSEGLLPNYHPNEIFMQDGATCHTSHSTREFEDANDICLLHDWPPQSPDLNIIENMWSELKEKVGKHENKTLNDLWESCKRVWMSIPNEYIHKLYHSIPSRIRTILKNKGDNGDY